MAFNKNEIKLILCHSTDRKGKLNPFHYSADILFPQIMYYSKMGPKVNDGFFY